MPTLRGARVALLEARMRGELAELVERSGGRPYCVPAVREAPLAHLEHHTQAYQRATHLHETVAAHLRRVDEQTEKHGKPLAAPRLIRRGAGSPDARAVVALLRRPSTARQALLASFVLAPPKALES